MPASVQFHQLRAHVPPAGLFEGVASGRGMADLTWFPPIRYPDKVYKNARRRSVCMKTAIPKPDGLVRQWHLIDAEDAVLGRVASNAALVLMGKHKPTYTPFLDTGDHIIVVNAAKVRLTGNKENQKLYRRHSGYPGGLTETKARTVRQARPARIVEEAIQGMLPKTKLGKQMYRKLQVYAGPKHPHQAQKPTAMAV